MAKLIQSIRASKLAPFIPTYSFQECDISIDPRRLHTLVEQTLRNIWTRLDLIDGACFIAGGIIERLFAFYNAPKAGYFSNDIDVFCFSDPRIRKVIMDIVEKDMYMTKNAITLEINLCIAEPTKTQFEKVQFIPIPTSTDIPFVQRVDNFIEEFGIDCCAMWYDRQTGLHIHPRAERALIEKTNIFRPIGSNAGSRALKYLDRGYDIILPELTAEQLQARLNAALGHIINGIFCEDREGIGKGNLRGLLRRVLKVVDKELVTLSYAPYAASIKPFHFSTKLCQAIERCGTVRNPTELLEWKERLTSETKECFGGRSLTSIMESLISSAEEIIEAILERGYYLYVEDWYLRCLRHRIETFHVHGLAEFATFRARIDTACGRIVHLFSEGSVRPTTARRVVDYTTEEGFIAIGYNEAMRNRGHRPCVDFLLDHASTTHHRLHLVDKERSFDLRDEAKKAYERKRLINSFLDGKMSKEMIDMIHRSVFDLLDTRILPSVHSLKHELVEETHKLIDRRIRELEITTDIHWMSIDEMFARAEPVFDRTTLDHWYDE